MADENVTIKATEMKALMEQMSTLSKEVSRLTAGNADITKSKSRAKRTKEEPDMTIMFIDDKPVVGMVNKGSELNPVKVYEAPDPLDKDKRILKVDLQVLNQKTDTVEVIAGLNFLDFMQEGERQECKVIKIIERKWYLDEGTVEQQEVKEYSMQGKGVDVTLEVAGVEYIYLMNIGGKEVEIHEDYVNMANSTPRREKTYE